MATEAVDAASAAVESFVQASDDAGRHAPYVAIAEWNCIVTALPTLPGAGVEFVAARVHQETERHLEGIVHLRRVEREREAGRKEADHGRYQEARAGQVGVEKAERAHEPRVEADLLLGLPQRGRERRGVSGVHPAAGKGDLA